jgi:WD40 repeat protein
MNWPTSQDYNEAVQDPAGSFSDPSLKGGSVVTNALGLPVPRSGNFADVYQFTDKAGKPWALKCFTRKVPGLRERYAKIDEHLNKAKLPFTVGFKFLQDGVKVHGQGYPLLKMEWVEGFTLNDFVAENVNKPQYLHALMQMWAKLCGRLRDANMAHADLQHGNVLLVPGATPQKLGLKLIDYDGMWVPALAEHHSGEVGHPNYQHPLRLREKLYNGDVDRFPHLVIAAALRATLIGGKALWDKFDNGDNLLFKEADFKDPANAPVFKALWELNDPVLRALVGHIALSIKQPLRKTPWLDDVLFEGGGPRLTPEQERQVCELLGVTVAAPAGAKAAPRAAVQQEFNVFEFLGDDDGPAPAMDWATTRRRPAKKSNAPLFIGAGVVAAVLLVGGVVAAVAMNNKKSSATQEVAQHKDKEKEKDDGPKGPPKIDPPPDKDPEPPPPIPAGDVGAANREALRQSLAGTKWNWGEGLLELRPDGIAYHPVWDQRFHLTNRWEVLDRRTVLIVLVNGRETERYGVLEFSEDLGHFSGSDFGRPGRMPNKPRVGPLTKPFAGPKTADTAIDLGRQLVGSQWEWDGGTLRLRDGNVAELPRIEGQLELTARWEPIDRRTALLLIEKGKSHDKLAILQFSEDLRELTGHDFDNAARLPQRKRVAATVVRPKPKGTEPDPRSPEPGPSILKLVREAGEDAGQPALRVGYRADGKYFWVRRNRLIMIGDGATGKEVKSFPVDATITHVAFGPGTDLYLATFTGKLQLWDWDKGEMAREGEPDQRLRAQEFVAGPDPNKLFVCTHSQTMVVWDAAKWKEVERFVPYTGQSVTGIVPFPDNSKAVLRVQGGGQRLSVWDLAKKKEVQALEPADGATVTPLDVSPDGKWVAGHTQNQLVFWDVKTGKLVYTIPSLKPGTAAGGFSPGGERYVLCEHLGRRLSVNLADGKATDEARTTPPSFTAAAHPAANRFVTADTDRKLRVWRFDFDTEPVAPVPNPVPPSPEKPPAGGTSVPAEGGFLKESAALSEKVYGVAITSDNKRAYAATHRGTVHVLDAATAAETAKADVAKAPIWQLVLAPKTPTSAEHLYAIDDDRHLHVLDADAKATRQKDVALDKVGVPPVSGNVRLVVMPGELYVMLFDPDGNKAFSWNPPRWAAAAIPPALRKPPFDFNTRAAGFSPDGGFGAAVASGKLLVWNQKTGKDVRLMDYNLNASWVGLSPDAGVVAIVDGSRVAAYRYDSGIAVTLPRDPHGILAKVYAAATPGGLVTAGSDKWLRVWDLKAGKELSAWRLEQEPAGVSTSPDGTRAAVWFKETNTVSLWALPDLRGKKP